MTFSLTLTIILDLHTTITLPTDPPSPVRLFEYLSHSGAVCLLPQTVDGDTDVQQRPRVVFDERAYDIAPESIPKDGYEE
jgi:hypothetical protein